MFRLNHHQANVLKYKNVQLCKYSISCVNLLVITSPFLFQASAAMLMTSVVFWVITRRRVVIIYRPKDHRLHFHSLQYCVQ
jgi:hypothetical protein